MRRFSNMSVKSIINKVCEERCTGALNSLLDIVYNLTSENTILTQAEKWVAYIYEQVKQGMVQG